MMTLLKLLGGALTYTLHQKKVTFNLSVCLSAYGSVTLTDGLDENDS